MLRVDREPAANVTTFSGGIRKMDFHWERLVHSVRKRREGCCMCI